MDILITLLIALPALAGALALAAVLGILMWVVVSIAL